MFTGIVEEKGKIKRLRKKGACLRLEIEADKACQGTKAGDSICVDGACLTVTDAGAGLLAFDVIPETLRVTTLKSSKPGDEVNLERALKAGDRLSGHFVTGHIDCVGVIRSRRISSGNLEFRIGIPPGFLKYVVRKGSVAVDGISLTVADVKAGAFAVCIIPHTARLTTIDKKRSADKVNIELDILAKRER